MAPQLLDINRESMTHNILCHVMINRDQHTAKGLKLIPVPTHGATLFDGESTVAIKLLSISK